jgi:hypothetical protein
MPGLFDFLLAYGFAFGAMNKVDFIRKAPFFDKMLNCSYCTGFHAGWLTFLAKGFTSSSLALTPQFFVSIALTPQFFVSALLWGLASAAFCYLADTLSQTAERAWADKAE